MINETSIHALQNQVQQWRIDGKCIGFVPTMGNLHAGHMALIHQAVKLCDKVVVSIFVNPLQFNEDKDFECYPRTLAADQQKLLKANVDILFLPSTKIIYPNGQKKMTKVCVPDITEMLEGESRPGHFDGVSTVVSKLFNIVLPHFAFFGEKDYQQLLLIQKMVEDLNFPIEIKAVITCRETDGLAMSSRNSRLSLEQRKQAPRLYQVLVGVRQHILAAQQPFDEIEKQAVKLLEQSGFEVDYVAIRNRFTLQTVKTGLNQIIILAAVRLENVRLIDNILID